MNLLLKNVQYFSRCASDVYAFHCFEEMLSTIHLLNKSIRYVTELPSCKFIYLYFWFRKLGIRAIDISFICILTDTVSNASLFSKTIAFARAG